MRKMITFFALLIIMTLISGIHISCSQEKNELGDSSPGLTAEAQQVADYLVKEDWLKQFSSTSIPLAMSNLGVKPNDELRLTVGQYFRDNLNIANNLKWWGANNYILSNEEKVIAKYLIRAYNKEGQIPGIKESNDALLGISKDRLNSRLAFMAEAGLLQKTKTGNLGYLLAEGHNRWGGPLGYNFHTVHIEGEKSFDVW